MNIKYHGMRISISVLALAAGAIVQAQTSERRAATAQSDQTLDEVLVTAQRRTESLQSAALTVEVIDSKLFTGAGVTTGSQLAVVAPSVQISTSGPALSVYIRGVGGFQTTAGTNPAVPFYADGVYVARTQSLAAELYDVDRVEVVKGPQGTLYGRNASGGAINVLTARPMLNVMSGHAEVELGNYSDRVLDAAINVPLGSTMALRASGTLVDKGGFTSVKFGDDKHQSGRLKLLWQPNSDVSLLLNGSYGHIGGFAAASVPLNKAIPGWYPWIDNTDPRVVDYAQSNSVAPPPLVRNSRTSDASQNLKFYNFSAQLDWNLGRANLTVLPAYRRSEMQYAPVLGFTYANGFGLGTIPARPETSDATSLETRLSGESGRLNWLAGLYLYDERQYQQYTINGGYIQNLGVIAKFNTTSYAAFTQNTIALSDSLRLIVGARYTSDKRELRDGQSYVVSPSAFLGGAPASAAACAFPAPTQPQCLVDSYQGSKTYQNFSWKAGFEADVLGSSLLYATASRGFKAGGFNTQSQAGGPGQALLYKPEDLISYEAGLKSRLLDNRLQANVSAFYWDYKNHQEPVLSYTNIPGITNLIYQNAGAAEIYGATLDLLARPWRGATINASVEFTKSKYTDYSYDVPTFSYSTANVACRVTKANPSLTSLDCAGFEVSRTPKWNGRLGVNQDFAIGTGTLSANVNYGFASSRWLGTSFIDISRAAGYDKLDASLAYRAPQDRYSVTAFVRNITNAAIYTAGAKSPFSALFISGIQPPRTYGIRLGVSF